jgi:hypothetical protein
MSVQGYYLRVKIFDLSNLFNRGIELIIFFFKLFPSINVAHGSGVTRVGLGWAEPNH